MELIIGDLPVFFIPSPDSKMPVGQLAAELVKSILQGELTEENPT